MGKNSLIFIQELYMHPRSEVLLEFTCAILPTIELKVANETYFISYESQIALQFLAANMAFPQVIDIICLGCDSKSVKVKSHNWQALTI